MYFRLYIFFLFIFIFFLCANISVHFFLCSQTIINHFQKCLPSPLLIRADKHKINCELDSFFIFSFRSVQNIFKWYYWIFEWFIHAVSCVLCPRPKVERLFACVLFDVSSPIHNEHPHVECDCDFLFFRYLFRYTHWFIVNSIWPQKPMDSNCLSSNGHYTIQ